MNSVKRKWLASKTRSTIEKLGEALDEAVESLIVSGSSPSDCGAYAYLFQLVGNVEQRSVLGGVDETVRRVAVSIHVNHATQEERHKALMAVNAMSEQERLVSLSILA